MNRRDQIFLDFVEAERLAAEEGLTLLQADNGTGWKGICYKGSGRSKPFWAWISEGGVHRSLGYYSTAAEAALAYVARRLGAV